MRNFKYYWLLHPINMPVLTENILDYQVCSRSVVVGGGSPLGVEGKIFFDILQRSVGLFEYSLWAFRNTEFNSQEKAKEFSKIFRTVSESFYTFNVSLPGFVIEDSGAEGMAIKQPPQVQQYTSIKLDALDQADLERIFRLSEKLYSMSDDRSDRFLSILDYLRDIRNSPVFVGELALWSFVENYWAQDQGGNTDINQSLKALLEFVYVNREDRRDINLLIRNVGADLGKQYD